MRIKRGFNRVESFLENLKASLGRRSRRILHQESLRSAAVLVPFFQKEGEPFLLLTRRSGKIQRHPGEIAFPGGRREARDADLFETALRETREEIGLDSAAVRLIGPLDDHETVSGFCVSPFVAVIPHPYPFRLDPTEIDGLIEVPFRFLLDPDRCQRRTILFRGKPRTVISYLYGDNDIWGATAEIIRGLVGIFQEGDRYSGKALYEGER